MKCLQQYSNFYRKAPLKICYNQYYYRSLILSSICKNASCITFEYQHERRFCTPSSTDNTPKISRERQLKESFISKYQRKIQKSSTSAAWSRYEKEIKGREQEQIPDPKHSTPQQAFHANFATPEYERPTEKEYDPHKVFGVPRATFRGLIIGISCLIGATLFVILRPAPISEDKERANMHYFARLNADPSVHVTYSGLMYKILDQTDLNDDETDLHLLTNPNPDIHCVDIDYEGRFINGKIFDSTFDGNSMNAGCSFPAKSLIAGLHQGLTNMTRDSVFEFYIPPHLGYGERGSEFIPPHEPLIFKVKLNDFWKDQDLNRPRRFKLVD